MSVLDLFNGQISLSEVLNSEIAILKELCEARTKLLEEKEKAKAQAMSKIENDRAYNDINKMYNQR